MSNLSINKSRLLCQFVPHDTSLSWACIVIHRCLWWIWPFLGRWRHVRVTFGRKPAGTRMPLPSLTQGPCVTYLHSDVSSFLHMYMQCRYTAGYVQYVSASVHTVFICMGTLTIVQSTHLCFSTGIYNTSLHPCIWLCTQLSYMYLSVGSSAAWRFLSTNHLALVLPTFSWNPFLSSRALACKVHGLAFYHKWHLQPETASGKTSVARVALRVTR